MSGKMHKMGSWQFDPEAAILRQGSLEKSLEDRSGRVLEVLCRRRGEVVSKDNLLGEVWQGRTVSANSVAIVIGDLRRILGDSPSEPAHIVTVGKRGYRLTPAPEDVVPETPRGQRWGLPLAFAAALILAGAATMYFREHRATPVELVVVPTRNETGQAQYDYLARSLTAVVTDRAVRFQGVRVVSSDGSAPPHARRVSLNSRLIIWNGTPELAITATDGSSHSVLWSTFATGDLGNLVRDAASKLDALQGRLTKTSTLPRAPFRRAARGSTCSPAPATLSCRRRRRPRQRSARTPWRNSSAS